MNGLKTILLAALIAAGGAVFAPARALAAPGAATIGFEAGLPLVAGFEASYRVRPAWRLGLQFGRVSGLTALGAEARWLIRGESRGFVPSLVAGAEQYFLEDGGNDATPVGVHLALGIDYFLYRAPVSLGAERIGHEICFSPEVSKESPSRKERPWIARWHGATF